MRLIDADALKQKAFGKRSGLIHTSDIDAMPTIEPERNTGHWVNVRDNNIADCSRCNARGRAWMNFCMICGADMRGEQNESEG